MYLLDLSATIITAIRPHNRVPMASTTTAVIIHGAKFDDSGEEILS